MSFRPTTCGSCGEALPIHRGPGRPRRYCNDACRYAARHDRDRKRAGGTVTLEPAPAIGRDELVSSLMLLVDPRARPAAPEDQLARALLELRTVEAALSRLSHDLPPRLAAPAGQLADTIRREMRRRFADVIA